MHCVQWIYNERDIFRYILMLHIVILWIGEQCFTFLSVHTRVSSFCRAQPTNNTYNNDNYNVDTASILVHYWKVTEKKKITTTPVITSHQIIQQTNKKIEMENNLCILCWWIVNGVLWVVVLFVAFAVTLFDWPLFHVHFECIEWSPNLVERILVSKAEEPF